MEKVFFVNFRSLLGIVGIVAHLEAGFNRAGKNKRKN